MLPSRHVVRVVPGMVTIVVNGDSLLNILALSNLDKDLIGW